MGKHLIVYFSAAAILLILIRTLSQERLLREYKSGKEPLREPANASIDINAACNEANTSLEACLNFTRRDVLNFLHFSKTGGTSLSNYMVKSLDYAPKHDGTYMSGVNLCTQKTKLSVLNSFGRVNSQKRKALQSVSRCTWDTLRAYSQSQLESIDFIYGHQYRVNGAEAILPNRHVRTFTVMRHPLSRKISFFYHFLVRAAGRSEEAVTFDELRDFLIYDKVPQTQEAFVVRHDIGPNYMTGRLLSDGIAGFVGNQYHTYFDSHGSDERAENAVDILQSFVFIGLQTQRRANICMLKKTLALFKKAHGLAVDDENMVDQVEKEKLQLNSGSYSYSFEKVLQLLSDEEIRTFERNEHSDLRIYEEGEQLFRSRVKQFRCESQIRQGFSVSQLRR